MSRFDVIVIGGGINGLTCANYLAKAGKKVCVLEARDQFGGLGAGEEFHPGYRSPGVYGDTRWFRRRVISELSLERHGITVRDHAADVLALSTDGQTLNLASDPAAASKTIADVSAADAERYGAFRAFLDTIRPVIGKFADGPPVDIINIESEKKLDLFWKGLSVRRLGKKQMLELLRLPPMCVADWLSEWFESDLLKAALALPAVAGTYTGPRAPGSNGHFLLRECSASTGVLGCAHTISTALEASARDANVELKTGHRVREISVSGGRTESVVLEDGSELAATAIVSAVDPKTTLLSLVTRGALPFRTEHRADVWRCRGTTGHVLLAVEGKVELGDVACEFARLGDSLDYLEKAFDAVKYRQQSASPALDVHVATKSSPELAPAGNTVLSIQTHFAPHELEGGWTDEARDQLGNTVVELLSTHVPDLASRIAARHVRSPADLESDYGIAGGHLDHGEHGLDQLLVRPMPECVGYRTPVGGLFLCSGGNHPGGGLTGAPGANAAQVVKAAL